MSVSSINDHIKPPKGAVFVRADARDGWFVITYTVSGKVVEFFYNQMGREVFRVDIPRPTRWGKFVEFWRVNYANTDTPPFV